MRRPEHCVNQTIEALTQERTYVQHVFKLQKSKHTIDTSPAPIPPRLLMQRTVNIEKRRDAFDQSNLLLSLIPSKTNPRPIPPQPREFSEMVKKNRRSQTQPPSPRGHSKSEKLPQKCFHQKNLQFQKIDDNKISLFLTQSIPDIPRSPNIIHSSLNMNMSPTNQYDSAPKIEKSINNNNNKNYSSLISKRQGITNVYIQKPTKSEQKNRQKIAAEKFNQRFYKTETNLEKQQTINSSEEETLEDENPTIFKNVKHYKDHENSSGPENESENESENENININKNDRDKDNNNENENENKSGNIGESLAKIENNKDLESPIHNEMLILIKKPPVVYVPFKSSMNLLDLNKKNTLSLIDNKNEDQIKAGKNGKNNDGNEEKDEFEIEYIGSNEDSSLQTAKSLPVGDAKNKEKEKEEEKKIILSKIGQKFSKNVPKLFSLDIQKPIESDFIDTESEYNSHSVSFAPDFETNSTTDQLSSKKAKNSSEQKIEKKSSNENVNKINKENENDEKNEDENTLKNQNFESDTSKTFCDESQTCKTPPYSTQTFQASNSQYEENTKVNSSQEKDEKGKNSKEEGSTNPSLLLAIVADVAGFDIPLADETALKSGNKCVKTEETPKKRKKVIRKKVRKVKVKNAHPEE